VSSSSAPKGKRKGPIISAHPPISKPHGWESPNTNPIGTEICELIPATPPASSKRAKEELQCLPEFKSKLPKEWKKSNSMDSEIQCPACFQLFIKTDSIHQCRKKCETCFTTLDTENYHQCNRDDPPFRYYFAPTTNAVFRREVNRVVAFASIQQGGKAWDIYANVNAALPAGNTVGNGVGTVAQPYLNSLLNGTQLLNLVHYCQNSPFLPVLGGVAIRLTAQVQGSDWVNFYW